MTAGVLISELSRFPPDDEVEIEFAMWSRITAEVISTHVGDVDRVEPNNGARRRILIRSNED